ncbi:MAG: DUF3501 family protein [Deltaproteobacteria bacterium]|jgi:hypothetical protein|nr:DUF3501 family protein [Deltaproteobacteria bacterium]MBW2533020.1 DUF3501 family protein [Deltaproteobacteria bacterium]
MKKVERKDIVDYVTWTKRRPEERPAILEAKKPRRIHVSDELTFLFENADTMRYQIQEMMRVEQIVEEAAILHELETYNDVLGDDGELAATLLIEIDSPEGREKRLKELMGLPERLYLRFDDDSRAYARFDERQVGEERLSSVQYLKFDAKGLVPVAVGADHPALTAEKELGPAQREALAADLGA